MNRRNFLITPPAMALAMGLAGTALPSLGAPAIIGAGTRILPRDGSKPRIVICGGGWGGMTAARYLRELIPDSDVVLLERNPTWTGEKPLDMSDSELRSVSPIHLQYLKNMGVAAVYTPKDYALDTIMVGLAKVVERAIARRDAEAAEPRREEVF